MWNVIYIDALPQKQSLKNELAGTEDIKAMEVNDLWRTISATVWQADFFADPRKTASY